MPQWYRIRGGVARVAVQVEVQCNLGPDSSAAPMLSCTHHTDNAAACSTGRGNKLGEYAPQGLTAHASAEGHASGASREQTEKLRRLCEPHDMLLCDLQSVLPQAHGPSRSWVAESKTQLA